LGLISRPIPSLFGGVSQQPPSLRLPSQSEAEVNCYSSVVDGVFKRPPMEHIAIVNGGDLSGAYIHTINRDSTEQYEVIISSGGMTIFDAQGVGKTVIAPNGTSYLNVPGGSTAGDTFAIVSIADYSFIINKKVTIAAVASTVTPPSGINYSYKPGDYDYLFASGGFAIPEEYYLAVAGGLSGEYQSFSDLPPGAAEGYIYKITGGDANSTGSYYVVRRGGLWVETVKPTDAVTLDAATMPHVLVRNADGTFTFTTFAWKRRPVGDAKSNPQPSFVGTTIADAFYYKNRLGFITGESVVFSCAGDYGNFWRNSVTRLLDSDVVDSTVSSSNTKVSLLKYAVPFANSLMLFADQTQFRLNVEKLLTPSSISIDTATDFEMSTKVRPIGLGPYVYFVSEFGAYSKVREYYVDTTQLNNDANDITAHVPRYLPKNVTKLTGSSADDALFALSKDAPRRIYVYKYFWGQQDKLQAAWSYWELPATDSILSINCLSNYLYVLVQRSSGAFLERINLQAGATTGDVGNQVLLDRLTTLLATYNSTTGLTTIVLPYAVDATLRASYKIVRGTASGTANANTMALLDTALYTWVGSSVITVPGNYTSNQLWGGVNYTQLYTFSEQFAYFNGKALTTGRLMLRTFTLQFARAAFFRTIVDPYGTGVAAEAVVPSQLAEFTGKTLGDAYLLLGTPVYSSGKYTFNIYGNSKIAKVSLMNDSHVQSTFQSVEWEALHFSRASNAP
jgi:hypothetical protein